jgi:predicted phosphohydrolase
MARLTWCTDIHLEFLNDDAIARFAKELSAVPSDGIVITGDISNSKLLVYHLSIIERAANKRVFFVLGNHDYYGSSFEKVRKQMHEVHNISQYLKYVSELNYVPLTTATAIVGHDGWYDAAWGDWQRSMTSLNDWQNIQEFVLAGGQANRGAVVAESRKLAHDATTHVMNAIKSAVRYHKHVVVLTHVPPFPQLTQGDADGLPWFTSKLMGDMLSNAAQSFPNVKFTVLCGHTHSAGEAQIAPNMVVRSAFAEYTKPAIAGVLEVP